MRPHLWVPPKDTCCDFFFFKFVYKPLAFSWTNFRLIGIGFICELSSHNEKFFHLFTAFPHFLLIVDYIGTALFTCDISCSLTFRYSLTIEQLVSNSCATFSNFLHLEFFLSPFHRNLPLHLTGCDEKHVCTSQNWTQIQHTCHQSRDYRAWVVQVPLCHYLNRNVVFNIFV